MAHVEHAPRSNEKMSYEQAQLYCFMFSHNGKKGWRLPTINEFIDASAWYQDAEVTKRKWYARPCREIK